jgi:hypothetical protein
MNCIGFRSYSPTKIEGGYMGFHFLLFLIFPFLAFANQEIQFKDTYIQNNSEYQRRLSQHKQFERTIEQLHKQCPQLNCQNTLQVQTIFQNQQFYVNQFPVKYLQILNQRAKELVQVWGDTILESDYIVNGKIRIDLIQAVYHNRQLITFKIVYSMQGFDLTQCPTNARTQQQCKPGRIYEGSFISANFEHAVIDKNQVAKFLSQ